MDISILNLPQAVLDDKAEFIVEMQFDDNKLMKDNRFFSDLELSISKHIEQYHLGIYAVNNDDIIYIYGKDNQRDFTNIWNVIFQLYRTNWIKKYLILYKWYCLAEIANGEEVEDMLEIFIRRGV